MLLRSLYGYQQYQALTKCFICTQMHLCLRSAAWFVFGLSAGHGELLLKFTQGGKCRGSKWLLWQQHCQQLMLQELEAL
jgi:hypothetical protein